MPPSHAACAPDGREGIGATFCAGITVAVREAVYMSFDELQPYVVLYHGQSSGHFFHSGVDFPQR